MSGLADLLKGAPPPMRFDDIRRLRDLALTQEEQRRLALEERRAFAREFVQERPVVGPLAMLVAPPLEQVYKGVQHLRGRQIGRSGYFAPMANIGAAYQGALEGMTNVR